MQHAAHLILLPIFEADFLPCSYGFRPKRTAHQALEQIRQVANHGHEWVVDADIQDCFGTIDHEKLLRVVGRRVSDRRVLKLLRKWLDAGVMMDGQVIPSTGAAQGNPRQGTTVIRPIGGSTPQISGHIDRPIGPRGMPERAEWLRCLG